MGNGPEYKNPPVIESVLSVQFAPLSNFTAAHAGKFWAEYFPKWPKAFEAAFIEDVFEEFPLEAKVQALMLRPGNTPNRIQLVDGDDERMIQIQSTRFVYNWRKREGHYPTYKKLLPEFKNHFLNFMSFCEGAKLGPIEPNQWEVSYVNHIPKGQLWSRSSEWPLILPGLFIPKAVSPLNIVAESLAGDWKYAIAENRARLHISLREGLVGGKGGTNILALNLTVRGGVPDSKIDAVYQGFELGHDTIVNTFAAITDKMIQEREWGRTH